MVNSESLSEMFKPNNSEEKCLQPVSSYFINKCPKVVSSSLDKSVQVNLEEICSSRTLRAPPDIEENRNIKYRNTFSSTLVSQCASSSLDLHLSSESEQHSEELVQDSTPTNLSEGSSEDCCLPESLSSSRVAEKPARVMPPSSGSPDMFAHSHEDFSQVQLIDSVPTKILLTFPDVLPEGPNGSVPSQVANREPVEEWSTQDLLDVSKNLKVRRKQIKRLIAEIIRKRQMEDETLEDFKKRLKRL